MSSIFGSSQIRLNLVDLIQQGVAPNAGGGVAGAIGSFFLRSGTGQAWLKTGAAATAWTQLQQSFAWYSVLDYGAIGDGATDDTAAIQAANDACATAGGGVVFFPGGLTYAATQLTINAQNNVQWLGAGTSSVIKWLWNAATVAGSLVTVKGGSQHIKIQFLKFDGSGLTNPAASRENHLLAVGAGQAVTEIQILNCQFGGMVASSGDGVNIKGGAGALVSRCWTDENNFDGCSRFGVCARQDYEYLWVESNYLTNCETEIALVDDGTDHTANSAIVQGNQINHTSATVRHAMRVEGGATTLITRATIVDNTVIGGFLTFAAVQWGVYLANVCTSGAFASADPVLRVFGSVSYATICNNVLDRSSGASVGPMLTVEKATTSPTIFRVGENVLFNETVGGGFIKVVDCVKWSAGGNLCRSSDADASVMFAIDVQAVTVNITDALIGPGNQMTAAAHSIAACVRLLANGANIVDASIAGNQGDNCDYGAQFEIGGGGGTVNTGQILYGGNNFDSSTGDFNNVGGAAVRPRIGLNAGVFGANLFTGTGSPEGVITARIGSIYLRSDGGVASVFYYKESGTGNTGWIGVGGSMITFGTGDTTTVATAVFLAPGWIATAIAAEIQQAVTRPGTIRSLYIQATTAGVTASTNTYVVRKNGTNTALTTTIGNTATGSASDLTHSFTVVAGDLLSVQVTKGGAVGTGQGNVAAVMELV